MGKIPSLLTYPIFRLTVSMAAGIFLFDRLGDGTLLLWQFFLLFCLLLLLAMCFYRTKVYALRLGFGIIATLCFFVFGGMRLLAEKERLMYHWEEGEAIYLGRVVTTPQQKGKAWQAEVEVEDRFAFPDSLQKDSLRGDSLFLSEMKGSQRRIGRSILWSWLPDSAQKPVVCGSVVVFEAKINRPISDVDLSGFDYAGYLLTKGMSGTAITFQGNWKVLDVPCQLSFKQRALRCRDWIVARYRSWNLGSDELAVVAALTIGDKHELTSELKVRYSAAGVSHVLALSGLHVGILSTILYLLFTPLLRWRYGKFLRSLGVVSVLWAFAFVSGLSPSVVRAVTMCTLYLVSNCVLEERFSAVYTVTLTAFLMLIYQPLYLFDLSFQLSFAAVYSILYFYPLMVSLWTVQNPLIKYVWNGLAVSISAQLGTLPLILYYFGTFPTYFLLANFLVGVLATCVLVGGLLALLVSSLPWIGSVAVGFLNLSAVAMNVSLRWIQSLKGAQWDSLSITCSQAVCGCIVLCTLYLFCTQRRPRYLLLMLLGFNCFLLEWNYHILSPSPKILFLSRGELFLKQEEEAVPLVASKGLFLIDTLRIGLMKSDYWMGKEAEKKIELDYICLCRGFRGSIQALTRVFTFQQVILDVSLNDRYRQKLIRECQEMKIPYRDNSKQGSFIIFL